MAAGRTGQATDQIKSDSGSTRPVSLEGDSPEVVAFALLRYLAQLEQPLARQSGVVFDREWLLDAYADCLAAVKGERVAAAGGADEPARKPGKGRGRAR